MASTCPLIFKSVIPCWLWRGLVVWPRLGDPVLSQNHRGDYAFHSLGQILGRGYTICSYGQITVSCRIPGGSSCVQLCLLFYSFWAGLMKSLFMWLIVSSLSLRNLHLLLCCVLSILVLIWLVLIPLFWAAIRRDSVSPLRFPFYFIVITVLLASFSHLSFLLNGLLAQKNPLDNQFFSSRWLSLILVRMVSFVSQSPREWYVFYFLGQLNWFNIEWIVRKYLTRYFTNYYELIKCTIIDKTDMKFKNLGEIICIH